MNARQSVQRARRLVVKIGSAVFLTDDGRIDRPAFASIVEGIDALLRQDRVVAVVSSGAVAMGRQWLGEPTSGREIPRLQALAALGQSRLMEMWEAEFSHYDRKVAQILFSRDDLSERNRYLNARRTLERLERFGAIPVINENDTVATEELRFGDNDELAAMTAGLIGAQAVVLLSDVEGFREVIDDGDPRRYGDKIDTIAIEDPRVDEWAGPSDSRVGTGGMISKVRAARIAARAGVVTAIAPGKRPGVLQQLIDGKPVGTVFDPSDSQRAVGRKVWLGGGAIPQGRVVCDEGAHRAIAEQGASLLPSGIVSVDGQFEEGEVVELVDENQEVFARGVSAYSAQQLRDIAGVHTSEIERILGFKLVDEAIHRDDMLVM